MFKDEEGKAFVGRFRRLAPEQARFLLHLGGEKVEKVDSKSGVEEQKVANGVFVDGEIFSFRLRPIVSAVMVGQPEKRFGLYDCLVDELFGEGIRMVIACVFRAYTAP